MGMSNASAAHLLALLLENTDWANIGDAGGLRGSSVAGSVYLALHSADPGKTGDQSTNEISYTGYLRLAVARTSGAWTITGTNPTTCINQALLAWAACTGGTATALYASIGRASAGAGEIIASGALGASLSISNGIVPTLPIGQLVATAN